MLRLYGDITTEHQLCGGMFPCIVYFGCWEYKLLLFFLKNTHKNKQQKNRKQLRRKLHNILPIRFIPIISCYIGNQKESCEWIPIHNDKI